MSAVTVRCDGSVATLHLGSPILTRHVLSVLIEAFEDLGGQTQPLPVVLASEHPTIFLAGAHLGEIAELDRSSCLPYARLGRSVAEALGSHPAPVVAAVHGSCSGGGFDLVMACDAVVAGPHASFNHPGVLRGLITGWGGTGRLEGPLGSTALRRTLLEGSALDGDALRRLGAVRTVAEDPRRAARSSALKLAGLHPSRLTLWRRFRDSDFVDRFRAFVVEKL
ncbi:MAG: enoyl-CoA hydratase/isomerase family protein [Thermoanaerobaculales bacterium]|jgi:enoyl-CoA hydratase/carnithine racemase|nr:enoyl-CoA hydratase/isomerase family protein [Thermoanaerobaculales bacterium]